MGNIKFGNSKLWIIESDESDKSLLKINPTHSIITNIGNDHLSKKELKKVFKKFGQKTKKIHQKKLIVKVKKLILIRILLESIIKIILELPIPFVKNMD